MNLSIGMREKSAMKLTDRQKKIIRFLQNDVPLESHPFRVLEETDGITEAEVISAVNRWIGEKMIRKFGALVRHRELGFTGNAMVVWSVPPDRCDSVGNRLAAFREVTHCYERTPPFLGKYNLFIMIHRRDSSFDALLQRMAEAAGSRDYLILESREELKKTSMEYF